MKNLIKILRYIIPYWGKALLNIGFNILAILFSLASFTLFIPVLNILFKTADLSEKGAEIAEDKVPVEIIEIVSYNFNSLKEYFNSVKEYLYYQIEMLIVKQGEMQVLLYICILIVVLFFLRNLFRYLALFYLAPIRSNVVRDIRNKLYRKILILPLSYYSEQRKGDIISRMTADVQEVEVSIMSSLEMMFRDPINIIVYLIALMVINAPLTLFVLVLFPISGFIIGRIGKSLKRSSVKGQKQLGVLLSIIEETISGLRIIKAFNAINLSDNNFKTSDQYYTRTMIRLYRKRDLASPISEFLSSIVMVIVLWYGGRLVLSPETELDAAMFMTYLIIFSQLMPPAKSMTTAIYNIQKGGASVERIHEVLDAEEVIVEIENPKTISEFKSAVEYKDVSFSYDKTVVLKNISLKLEKGKTIALVGPSGGGKSTFVDLLPRFYDCVSGEILIDGTCLKEFKIDDVRGLMGIVSQETILFNDTVMGNITMGIENVNEDDVIAAAKVANAHEFISKMENGYHTNIGDRGVKLSGGQRQRISIARAVLKNPPILILDEATSALDTESERLVQDALLKLMQNRTSIVIAHRLSTIQFADEIVVISKGEIVERGKHAELLALGGVYKRLFDLQSFA
ncbi:MAG: ABC transporter ATP-binding protein/permease [Bacteroidetes bacterium]|nr:ABC transporter ATP-binding protein/permease [Bacteroidota bacterium]